jgi:predicted nuclease of restriction endonuclease-like (RecB) superfamily
MKYAELIKVIDATSQKLLGHAAAVVNQSLVIRNWLVGAYIVEFEQHGNDRAKYGARLLESLGRDLKARRVRGMGVSILERSRRFYLVYPEFKSAIPQALLADLSARGVPGLSIIPYTPATDSPLIPYTSSTESSGEGRAGVKGKNSGGKSGAQNLAPLRPHSLLSFSWSHWSELIRLDDPLKRAFYENECLKGNWSVRQLQRQIGALLFERTGLSSDKAAVLRRARQQEPKAKIEELIRDPYVLEFAGLAELPCYNENQLERALLDHLQQFLLELGTGFCFEARQFRVTIGNEHDYVDLVFYHRVLRCHVLLDLKVRPFRHGDAGQMNYYLNYFKKCVMREGDNPPVGILLCSDRESTKVEFATSGMENKLFVSRYLVALPSPEELQHFIEQDRAQIEAFMAPSTPPVKRNSPAKKERPGN